jgi:type IV secretory pathway VirB3-like protein
MNSLLPNQSTQAIAVLVVCFAKTIGEKDPEFIALFQKNIEEMYQQMRDNSYFPSETLQAVRLAGDLLKI